MPVPVPVPVPVLVPVAAPAPRRGDGVRGMAGGNNGGARGPSDEAMRGAAGDAKGGHDMTPGGEADADTVVRASVD